MHSGLKKRENSAIKSLSISGFTSVSKPKINVFFLKKKNPLSDCMSPKPINSKKYEKPYTSHYWKFIPLCDVTRGHYQSVRSSQLKRPYRTILCTK